MDKIKRVILFNLPMSVCNFRCDYCYLTHRKEYYQNKQLDYQYSPEYVAKALSPVRLGGLAYMNFCTEGETLLTKDLDKYIYELVKLGHYAEIVTNLSVTPVLERILSWDKEVLKRIEFKCSFHYLELKKKNLLDTFASNVKKIWDAGASANIEFTPSDELIPFIDELKTFSIENFGALPHLTIARNDNSKNIEYLTDLSIEEYDRVWGQFESGFWEFKKTIFKQKRKEFCYAGDWMLYVRLEDGRTTQCYKTNFEFNIFEDIDKPIPFKAIGKCKEPHCYNGHALMTLGCIPHFTEVRYGDIRNRVKADDGEWLQPELLSFFNSQLIESNHEYGWFKKFLIKSEINGRFLVNLPKKVINRVKRK